MGNGIEKCRNGEDEKDFIECIDGEFKCMDNKRCLPRKYICDGNPNCVDGSDEVEACSYPTMYRYIRRSFTVNSFGNGDRDELVSNDDDELKGFQPKFGLIPWNFIMFESKRIIYDFFPEFQPQHDFLFGPGKKILRNTGICIPV